MANELNMNEFTDYTYVNIECSENPLWGEEGLGGGEEVHGEGEEGSGHQEWIKEKYMEDNDKEEDGMAWQIWRSVGV